jgi:hypothetical protein
VAGFPSADGANACMGDIALIALSAEQVDCYGTPNALEAALTHPATRSYNPAALVDSHFFKKFRHFVLWFCGEFPFGKTSSR